MKMIAANERSHQGRKQMSGRGRHGFTIVELLVVISLIALLISLLMPGMRKARENARTALCSSNLRQIHIGTTAYAMDHRDKMPDAITLGRFSFRMGPGMKTPDDPAVFPEIYGWAAVLNRGGHLPYVKDNWVCPSQEKYMADYGTTYAFSIAAVLATQTVDKFNQNAEILWDNFTLYPGLSGFMGPFGGYTIPTVKRTYPHTGVQSTTQAIGTLRVNGAAGVRGQLTE